MPVLFYKDPGSADPNAWIPFGTTDPVANEVEVRDAEPTDPLTELWVNPAGTGSTENWPAFDARYVSRTDTANSSMSVPLTLSGPPSANLHATTKQYVDTSVYKLTNSVQMARNPVGTIVMFAGRTIPAGWHRCDGKPHNSWSLQNALQSPNTPALTPTQGVGYIVFGGI